MRQRLAMGDRASTTSSVGVPGLSLQRQATIALRSAAQGRVRPSVRNRPPRASATYVRRWDSADRASVARVLKRCQTYVTIEVPSFHDAPLPEHPAPRGHRRRRGRVRPGLNVLTGETGAGKSILVEAVGLLLGGRASADLVRTGEDTRDHRGDLRDAGGGELIVRREITRRAAAARSSTARSPRPARSRTCRRAWSSCTASTSTRRCSIRSTHLDLLDAFGGARADLRAPSPPAFGRLASAARDERVGA